MHEVRCPPIVSLGRDALAPAPPAPAVWELVAGEEPYKNMMALQIIVQVGLPFQPSLVQSSLV